MSEVQEQWNHTQEDEYESIKMVQESKQKEEAERRRREREGAEAD